MKELLKYGEATTSDVKDCVEKIAVEAAKELRDTAPKNTGEYAKSWKAATVKESSQAVHKLIYAGNGEYRLTHLLEKGHAKRNGGRVEGVPHIEPVEKKYAERLETEIRKVL